MSAQPRDYDDAQIVKAAADISGKKSQAISIRPLVLSDNIESNIVLSVEVTAGLPASIVEGQPLLKEALLSSGVIPRKTLEDALKSPSKKLTPANSERVIRVMRLIEKAKLSLGDDAAAVWMQKSNKNFNGLSAMQMAKTESGARAVEQFLLRIAHGFNA